MIDARGWSITICDEDHIHVVLIDGDERLISELILNTEDIKRFCDDMAECISKLRMRKAN